MQRTRHVIPSQRLHWCAVAQHCAITFLHWDISTIVALCVFGRGVFTGPLPSKDPAIHVTIQYVGMLFIFYRQLVAVATVMCVTDYRSLRNHICIVFILCSVPLLFVWFCVLCFVWVWCVIMCDVCYSCVVSYCSITATGKKPICSLNNNNNNNKMHCIHTNHYVTNILASKLKSIKLRFPPLAVCSCCYFIEHSGILNLQTFKTEIYLVKGIDVTSSLTCIMAILVECAVIM
jgi:hypothetical protein